MSRRWPLLIGLLVLGVAWAGPVRHLVAASFSVHMAVHVAVVAVAPPFLAVGLAGSRWDPARHWPRLVAPLPAMAVEFLAVWAWHAPLPHHLARTSSIAFAAEQASFLIAGLLLWLAAFGGGRGADEGIGRARAAGGAVALLLTSMHMTLLGVLLSLAPRPLFALDGELHFGLTELGDQQFGGTVMLIVGGATYLAGGLVLAARLLRPSAEHQ